MNEVPWLSLLEVAGGLALLIGGGEVLVGGAIHLARRLGMSPLLVGLTVVAFGTSAPELGVCLSAALRGHPEITIGNVVGSNVANLALILGISALVKPLAVRAQIIKLELPLLAAASLALTGLAWTGGIGRLEGTVAVILLAIYLFAIYRRGRKEKKKVEALFAVDVQNGTWSYPRSLGFIIGGLLLLGAGSNLLVGGAVDVARWAGVPELLIGLTLAAVGTSLPELAACMSAARRGEGDIAVGNLVGSNLFNLLFVLGLTAAVVPIPIGREVFQRDLPVMLLVTVAMLPIMGIDAKVKRWEGAALLASYCAYMGWLFHAGAIGAPG